MPKDTKTLCIKKGCASVLTQPLPRQETSVSDIGNARFQNKKLKETVSHSDTMI